MLPKIDEFKTCVFTTRLVNFNETFSELGKHGKDTAVVWHEAISGTRDEDSGSAFHKYIDGLRDTKKSLCGQTIVQGRIKTGLCIQ